MKDMKLMRSAMRRTAEGLLLRLAINNIVFRVLVLDTMRVKIGWVGTDALRIGPGSACDVGMSTTSRVTTLSGMDISK